LAFPVCALLGVLAAVASGESRPTLKFAGSAPATVAIEEAFKMSLDNLIDINSIPYDPGKWNDTGLLETATDSRFLRAAPAYGDNPWVHDGAFNTWSAMNLLEANDGRATRVARNTLWACCDMEDGKPVVSGHRRRRLSGQGLRGGRKDPGQAGGGAFQRGLRALRRIVFRRRRNFRIP
jgi:hypothetical protein